MSHGLAKTASFLKSKIQGNCGLEDAGTRVRVQLDKHKEPAPGVLSAVLSHPVHTIPCVMGNTYERSGYVAMRVWVYCEASSSQSSILCVNRTTNFLVSDMLGVKSLCVL